MRLTCGKYRYGKITKRYTYSKYRYEKYWYSHTQVRDLPDVRVGNGALSLRRTAVMRICSDTFAYDFPAKDTFKEDLFFAWCMRKLQWPTVPAPERAQQFALEFPTSPDLPAGVHGPNVFNSGFAHASDVFCQCPEAQLIAEAVARQRGDKKMPTCNRWQGWR